MEWLGGPEANIPDAPPPEDVPRPARLTPNWPNAAAAGVAAAAAAPAAAAVAKRQVEEVAAAAAAAKRSEAAAAAVAAAAPPLPRRRSAHLHHLEPPNAMELAIFTDASGHGRLDYDVFLDGQLVAEKSFYVEVVP